MSKLFNFFFEKKKFQYIVSLKLKILDIPVQFMLIDLINPRIMYIYNKKERKNIVFGERFLFRIIISCSIQLTSN